MSEKTIESEVSEEESGNGTRYDIKERIGRGGAADVYLAYDTQLRRDVIIKRLREDELDVDALSRVWSEASKIASLHHANVVTIFDVISLSSAPSIVMEHLIGESVEERADRRVFSEEDFVELARQSLEGLSAAHQSGLIHRDIKPSNIMLVSQPFGRFQVKLIDFGMAKFLGASAPSSQTVSIDGSITCSIYFTSPEQLNHEPVDARSDLYSLGCTFYYALTGKYPFNGEQITDVISAHLLHKFIPLGVERPDLSPFIAHWVASLFERHPGERYSSAMDALRSLQQSLAGNLSGATSRLMNPPIPVNPIAPRFNLAESKAPAPLPPLPEKNNSFRLAWLAIAACLLLLCGGFWLFLSSQRVAPSMVMAPASVLTLESLPVAEPATPPAIPMAPPAIVSAVPDPIVASEQVSPPPAPAPEVIFRLTGSNTIGSVVGPSLLKAFFNSKNYTETQVNPSGNPAEKSVVGLSPNSNAPVAAFVAAHGSGTAFKDLAAGTNDAGMSSRPIKPEESAQLARLGDMQSVNCEHVIGLDGLAIIVNRSNPIPSLSVQQVAAIFKGQIKDWSQVGGSPGSITRYGRNDVSGTFDSFQSMVLGKDPLATDTERFEDSAALSDAVSLDAQAIGFIGLPYIRQAKVLAISEEGAPPLFPSPFTIATEDYALSRRLYVYTAANPENSLTREFIEFSLSPAGQDIVRQSGFVSQNIELESFAATENSPTEYLKAIGGAKRLSASCRFTLGNKELDGKARRDIDRIVQLLAQPAYLGKKILLLGFSDASGSPTNNRNLSDERAQVVAGEFAMRGITPTVVTGFGASLPVASNATDHGRAKNRRVEVWFR